jgi:hypothetical protein
MSTGRGEEQDRVAISMGCLRCVLRGHRRGGTEDPKHDVNIYDEDIIKQDYDNGDHLGAGVDGHGDEQDERRDDGPAAVLQDRPRRARETPRGFQSLSRRVTAGPRDGEQRSDRCLASATVAASKQSRRPRNRIVVGCERRDTATSLAHPSAPSVTVRRRDPYVADVSG